MHCRKTDGLRQKDLIGIRKFEEGVIMAMFKKIVKNLGPKWVAAVMGTAAICITMQSSSEVAVPFSSLLYVGLGFYLLATVIFTAFLIPGP